VHNALGQRLFKTEPQYAPVASGSNPSDPGVIQTLANFFASLWGGTTATANPSAADKLGFQYYYGDTEGLDGSLLYEQGTGGANSTGSVHYIYLPTPAGPMPIATYTGNGRHYAVHTDHLNTPRRLTQSNKQVAWQWAFSAFGDEQPTTAKNRFVDPSTTPNAGSTTVADVTFNLRYPGQYFDKESGLHYNYFRSYDAKSGRYSQSDPIGLQGGWNRFAYGESNPLMYTDPFGLDVFLCSQPAFGIPNNPLDHQWLRTDTAEAGMGGTRGNIPGNQSGDMPGDPVQVTDHTGRSKEKGASCTKVDGVDEKKVNDSLRIGRPLGRWGPTNQCQSFARQTLIDAGWKQPRPPYISNPLPAFGF
jgi:RHS repeat-associated protein